LDAFINKLQLWWSLAGAGVHLAVAIVLGGVALLASGWLHLWYWTRRLRLTLDYELQERLTTSDGAWIELRRIPREPGRGKSSALPPVVLVHGVASNHRNQDADPDTSLARFLGRLGRDVWLVTLRSGLDVPRAVRNVVTFAAMARHDLPLAIAQVQQRSGHKQVDFVGFSMGGMLLYAALGRWVPSEWIRRAVMIGAPGRIEAPLKVPAWLGRIPVRWVPKLPLRTPGILFAFLSETVDTRLSRVLLNPSNLKPGMIRFALGNCVCDVAGPLHGDFLRWASGDGVLRVDGERVLDRLGDVRIPALFVAGAEDRIAPVQTVRDGYEAWAAGRASTPKRMLVLGREFGAQQDYGHGDLALGAQVRDDLFEPVGDFLADQNLQYELPGASPRLQPTQDVVLAAASQSPLAG
jgi:polyhydroxyalkanoate synthase subunit PhaC